MRSYEISEKNQYQKKIIIIIYIFSGYDQNFATVHLAEHYFPVDQ